MKTSRYDLLFPDGAPIEELDSLKDALISIHDARNTKLEVWGESQFCILIDRIGEGIEDLIRCVQEVDTPLTESDLRDTKRFLIGLIANIQYLKAHKSGIASVPWIHRSLDYAIDCIISLKVLIEEIKEKSTCTDSTK